MAMNLDRLLYPVLRLGWAGAVGAGLIVAALVLDAGVLVPLEAERNALVEKNALAAVVKPVAGVRPGQPAMTAHAETAEATLRRLFAAARQAGLSLDQGDYQLGLGQDGRPARYQFTLPVLGAYPAIRGFIAQMLNEDPALALGAVEMSRPTIEDNELDATLHFVLYLKEAR